jgi:hypothetical protein
MSDLGDLKDQSNTVLFRCQTVFPFTLFPSEIEVTQNRIDIKYGLFFFTYQVMPLLIKDLINIVTTNNLFFGNVTFEIRNFEQNPTPISFLRKEDSIKLKNIVVGLIETAQADLDLPAVNAQQKKVIEEIGTSPTA